MNVLVVEPGFLPYEKEVDGLRDMQKLVGGHIQAIYPFQETVALVCNESGMIDGLEFNRSVPERGYGGICGTFFLCGLGEEDFVSLTPEQVKTYKDRFKKAEVFIAMNGDKPFTISVDATPKYLPEEPKHPRKPLRGDAIKFDGFEHFDHFPDSTVFWAALSNPPAELEREAKLIDGDNYNETSFGVCVDFDAETQNFIIVVDMDGDEACNVHYIDNDGEKHWFACELPEELTKRIFSECQQVLDFKKTDYGYEIKESIQFEDGTGLVLAENPGSERPFLTARFFAAVRGQRYYGERNFFHHQNDAIEDFTKRAEHQKQFPCVKPGQPQADEHPKKDAKQSKSRTNRPKHKRR